VCFEGTFHHRDDAARTARQKQIDRISGAPADRLAGHEFPMAIKKNRARLGLRIDINANHLTVVVRPVLDFKGTAADAQGRISAENQNAGRRASAVLPRGEFFLAMPKRPVAGVHEPPTSIERECLPRVRTRGLRAR
jgi:hypothetical protein